MHEKCSGSEPNVQVRSNPEPEPPLRFVFDDFAEPKPRTLCSVRVRTLFAMFRTGPRPVYLGIICSIQVARAHFMSIKRNMKTRLLYGALRLLNNQFGNLFYNDLQLYSQSL